MNLAPPFIRHNGSNLSILFRFRVLAYNLKENSYKI